MSYKYKGVRVTYHAMQRWRERVQPDKNAKELVTLLLDSDTAGDKLTKRALDFFGDSKNWAQEHIVLINLAKSVVFLCHDNVVISVATTDQLGQTAKMIKKRKQRVGKCKKLRTSGTYKRPTNQALEEE